MSEHFKTYLGDAVYASMTDWGDIVLTTEDGIRATNRIVLEGAVLASFEEWRSGAERRVAELRCPECQEHKGQMHPSHWGRATCESGSLASGGERSHCSCDVCF